MTQVFIKDKKSPEKLYTSNAGTAVPKYSVGGVRG